MFLCLISENTVWHATCAASKKPPYNVHDVHQPFAFRNLSGEHVVFHMFTKFTTFTEQAVGILPESRSSALIEKELYRRTPDDPEAFRQIRPDYYGGD
jgi:hypothetical protein